ncbi:MAG: hypothetical protein HRT55_16005 [Colwellia sp.]|uniref:hypothetical protein n=1 Tax=Alteromonadales TaxID=135622 RepID=UPI001D893103|nr:MULTISPECIES: hypothetical protein [Alteromonadales]NQZ27812.1 hypothetical protein [Colwellia sp.]NRA80315.1 hypothetical protein [Pseudoalteromonas sp.]
MKKVTSKAKKTIRVKTIKENETGRNLRFKDTKTKKEMTDKGFVRAIKKGEYDGYHIRRINGVDTPVSNPNGISSDNLG